MTLDTRILDWILAQPNPGWYGIAVMRSQATPWITPISLPKMLRDLETEVIADALNWVGGNVSLAAYNVGIKRTTFSARARALGIVVLRDHSISLPRRLEAIGRRRTELIPSYRRA